MTARDYFWSNSNGDLQAVFPGLMISVFFHVALAVLILFAPNMKSNRRIMPDAMSVSLVSMPEPRMPGPPRKKTGPPKKNPEPPAAKKAVAINPEPEPIPPPKAPVETEPEVKSSLKKKTFKTGKVVEKVVKEIEKKVTENRPDAIKKAIDQIREKTNEKKAAENSSDSVEKAIARLRETVDQTRPEEGDGESGFADESGGGSGGGGGKEFDQIDLYKLEVKYRIQKNWAYSEQLAGRQSGAEALLVIRVMANGEIKDVWFEKKSGNPLLDDSAYKAVLKSNPLPPLPAGFNRPFFTLGMIFTPSGLQ